MTLSLLAERTGLRPAWVRFLASRPAAKHTLAAEAVRTLTLQAGVRLSVQHGRLWITTPGDAADHFVDAGQSHAATRRQTCIVQACGGLARFSVARD